MGARATWKKRVRIYFGARSSRAWKGQRVSKCLSHLVVFPLYSALDSFHFFSCDTTLVFDVCSLQAFACVFHIYIYIYILKKIVIWQRSIAKDLSTDQESRNLGAMNSSNEKEMTTFMVGGEEEEEEEEEKNRLSTRATRSVSLVQAAVQGCFF